MNSSHSSNHNNSFPEVATQNALFSPESLKSKKATAYVNKVWDIRTSDASDEGALAFMARCFIQATLPHSDPKDLELWIRQNGIYTLEVSARKRFDPVAGKIIKTGLPYGSIPRLLFVWMTTEAIRTKEPRLLLGKSLSEFMGKLGLTPSGGKKGDITRLKSQAARLFKAEFTLMQQKGEGLHEKDLKVSNERMLFWNHKNPEQNSLWDSWINLTPEFFDTITLNPAPLDMRALSALKSSSMALDLYMWLSHRTFYLDNPQRLSWKALEAQLGSNYSELKIFRLKVRRVINKIKVFWPELNADFDNPEIITLYPSKSLISLKDVRQDRFLFSR